MNTLVNSLGIKVKFCSVQSHESNPAECSIQSISNLRYRESYTQSIMCKNDDIMELIRE